MTTQLDIPADVIDEANQTDATQADPAAPVFGSSEGLRILLVEFAYSGPDAWHTIPEAAELMGFVMDKYSGLAHKHGLTASDAAIAAFEVMRLRSTRVAEDPWAVVTHAVELSLIYESRAEGLLCSTAQARKTAGLEYHDAARFADRDTDLADFHPAFQVHDNHDRIHNPAGPNVDGEPSNAFFALDAAVRFFTELGWMPHTARLGLEYIAARLDRCGDPKTAYVSLRRDGNGPGWLDVDQHGWLTMLRVMLGDPRADFAGTSRARGILLRLVTGEAIDDLFKDHGLVDAVQAAAPTLRNAGTGDD
ncbi:MAG: hypothetical protein ACSLE3_14405 [Microbacteriaceae bacterium]